MSDGTLSVTCPCCQAVLTVDTETGDVLMHKEASKKPVLDIGDAVRGLKQQAGRREEEFKKNMDAEKRRGETLKKKFDEAFKKAQEDPDAPPPPREIDLD